MQDTPESCVIQSAGVLAVGICVRRCWEQLRNFRGWEDISVEKEQEEKKNQTVVVEPSYHLSAGALGAGGFGALPCYPTLLIVLGDF